MGRRQSDLDVDLFTGFAWGRDDLGRAKPNKQLKRNLEKQVAIYEAANETRSSVKAIVCYTASQERRVVKILKELHLQNEESVVVIDARNDNKPSASKA